MQVVMPEFHNAIFVICLIKRGGKGMSACSGLFVLHWPSRSCSRATEYIKVFISSHSCWNDAIDLR